MMTDEELNKTVQHQFYDPIVKWTLLWMFPYWVRPNHITVVRFLASPIVFWILWQGWYKLGLVVFLLVALTDAIDGAMARTRRQITVWGTTYDGVADKLLIGGAVLVLALKYLDPWLTGCVIGIELFSTAGGLYYKWTKGVVHPALWWGKIKMNLHVIATALLLLDVILAKPLLLTISSWIFIASLGFSVMNIIAHFRIEQLKRV